MRAIIIGAGRGSRLMPTTENAPKCFAEIQGKRILDWTVEALKGGGCTEICFIGGYRIEAVQREYPDFVFRENRRLGEQQHPGLADVRRGPDGPAVRDSLLRHPVHRGSRARRWCSPGTSWRSASIPTGASTTSRAPSIRRTMRRR